MELIVDEEIQEGVVETSETPLKVAGAVPRIVSDDVTDDLKILLGEFEGPLDLLLHLIRQQQVSMRPPAIWRRQ